MTELQGTDILFRRWNAAPGSSATTGLTSPKAVFLLVHGLGAHSARWDFMARDFAGRGYTSYAL